MLWRGDPHSRWHGRGGYSLTLLFCSMGNIFLLNHFFAHENFWPPWAFRDISECPSPRYRHTEIPFQKQMNGIILYDRVNGSMASGILSPQRSMLLLLSPSYTFKACFLQSCFIYYFAWCGGLKIAWNYTPDKVFLFPLLLFQWERDKGWDNNGWDKNLLKTNCNKIRNTEKQCNSNNKSMPKGRFFTHKRCSLPQLSMLGCWDKDKMPDALPRGHSQSLSTRQWIKMMGKPPKSWNSLCCVTYFDCWAQLCLVASACLRSSLLGWAWLGWAQAQAQFYSPMALPTLSPWCSAGLSCACCLELHSSWGTGRDRQ